MSYILGHTVQAKQTAIKSNKGLLSRNTVQSFKSEHHSKHRNEFSVKRLEANFMYNWSYWKVLCLSRKVFAPWRRRVGEFDCISNRRVQCVTIILTLNVTSRAVTIVTVIWIIENKGQRIFVSEKLCWNVFNTWCVWKVQALYLIEYLKYLYFIALE